MVTTIVVAFVGGIVSFLAPCVLPIVPGFIIYLAGGQGASPTVNRRDTFINSLLFVIGFALVFAVLGVLLNTLLVSVASSVQLWLSRLGGALIIFFGLYLVKLIQLPWLEQEHKLNLKIKVPSRYLTSLLFGAAFAVGWSPCVGAVLGAILALAVAEPSRAFLLLLAYALGLGLPFLLVGLFTAQATKLIQKSGQWIVYLNSLFGIVLIIIGILVFTENLSLIANWSLLNTILLR